MRTKIPILLIALINVLVSGCSKPFTERTDTLKPILNFNELKPAIHTNYLSGCTSMVALDTEDNFYFCETDRHRVLKFSLTGAFKKQFGRIGRDETGLYYPQGIHVNDGKLYILDKGGKYIKTYDLNGRFLKSITLNGEIKSISDSIVIDDGYFYTDTRTYIKGWKNNKLISVFTEEGAKVNSFGRIVPANRVHAYRTMNRAYLTIREQKVYGAYELHPAVFCYNLKGEELLYINLKELRREARLDFLFRHDGLVDSYSDENSRKVAAIKYFWGFAVNEEGNFLITLNDFDNQNGYLLVLNSKGIPLEKITFKANGKIVFPLYRVLRHPNGRIYFIGKLLGEEDRYLFEWNKQI